MLMTLAGIVREPVKPEQLENALSSIHVTLVGISKESVRLEQSEKARFPI